MTKLGNPFGKGKTIRITRVAHNHLGNLKGFSLTQANDLNADPFQREIYAEGDGAVEISVNNQNPSSYIQLAYDGLPSDLAYQAVHVRPEAHIRKGTRVIEGMLIGRLEPFRANWYTQADGSKMNHAPHIHHQVISKSNGGAANPFSYMDRTQRVIATHPAVLAYENWFINGKFNWNKFPNLSLKGAQTKKVGDRVEFAAKTNLRIGSYIPKKSSENIKSRSPIIKGAVGVIVGGPRTSNGYTWWDVKFLNDQGWVANVNGTRLAKTTKATTNVNGTKPKPPPPPKPEDPCGVEKDKIIKLEGEKKSLQETNTELEKDLNTFIKLSDELGTTLEKKKARLKLSNQEKDKYKKQAEDLLPYKTKTQNLKIEIIKKDKQIADLKAKCSKEFSSMTVGEIIGAIVTKIKGVWMKEGKEN